jgi:hypothetical protein
MTPQPRRMLLVALASGCVHQTTVITKIEPVPPPGPNELSSVEKVLGWQSLFDGRSFAGWHGLGFTTVPPMWTIDAGTIKRVPGITAVANGKAITEVDLISDSTFQDFELTWEWKIGEAGNSGLKYNVAESLSVAMDPPHSAKGWEYQINDDLRNDDNKLASHRSGALYDVIPPSDAKQLNPAGEWNRSGLLVRGTHAEHWLNGRKILEYDLGSTSFDSAVAASKYAKYPAWFRIRRAGQIVLQDHGDPVWFRNIKILTLK